MEEQKSSIIRMDKINCYPTLLLKDDFRIPSGDPQRYYGNAANYYINSTITDTNILGVVKCWVYPPVKRTQPYFSMKLNNKTHLTLCNACTQISYERGIDITSCDHTMCQRKFLATTDLKDIYYTKQLGYKFDTLEVILFNGIQPRNLQSTIKFIVDNSIDSGSFMRKWLKITLLSSLGRFGINSEKYPQLSVISETDFYLYLTCHQIDKYHFLGSQDQPICVATLISDKISYGTHYKKQIKLKTNSIIFASLVSQNRRAIHNDCMRLKLLYDVSVIRCDTDSILVQCKNMYISLLKNFIHKQGYLEEEAIIGVLNISPQSYLIWYRTGSVQIKICGLVLSYQSRKITVYNPNDFVNLSIRQIK
jgi:hypothetical protein